jgi:2-phosphosulfolactate phosphatase
MSKTPDVFITGRSFQEDEVKGKVVVVIDVLRAASTIVTALNNGARGIIPVADMGSAGQIAQNLDPSGYLLCGEKDGKPIEDFHLGNSPEAYTGERVKDKTLILYTTNGTPTLVRCSGAKELIIGSFLNAAAVAEHLKSKKAEDIIFVCSGWKSRLSFEDTLCAGYMLRLLNGNSLPGDAPDGARLAFALYDRFGGSVAGSVSTSNHAERLKSLLQHRHPPGSAGSVRRHHYAQQLM